MWHKVINENKFISLLYDEVPEIINTRILNIEIEDEGERLTVLFMMPKYADNPPEKWRLSPYNRVIVKLGFYDIEELSLTYNSKEFLSGDIKIDSNNNMLDVNISGTLNLRFKAPGGVIQSVKGSIVDTLE